MRNYKTVAAMALPLAMFCASAAHAAAGDPVKFAPGLTFDPIIDGRLRYEGVDTPTVDADSVTMRLRAGFELKHTNGLSFLAEAEGILALDNSFNAFPFAVASRQRRTQYAVVPDAETIGINRLQVAWKGKPGTLTIGRQRINLDDQRFVGSVAWRQDEQTFDAVRAEGKLGPVGYDVTYSNAQRTIFGVDARERESYGGDFVFAQAFGKLGPVNAKAFSYLLSYDEGFAFANSSASYGGRATATVSLAKPWKLNLIGSYARQTDYGSQPVRYGTDFYLAEATLAGKALSVTGGYEVLGGDDKAKKAFQTPMATLHKFNGFADLFLTTPQTATYGGLRDGYATVAYKFDKVKALPGLNAAVSWHRFTSDYGGLHYGDEWNAVMSFKVKRALILAKYADYQADRFGVDTRKMWLEVNFAY
jgi:hypothetical protein